ncbi:hypothetical protein [Synoicihabitans lomoniglobus]
MSALIETELTATIRAMLFKRQHDVDSKLWRVGIHYILPIV